ncbi:nucleotide exchange factor GrpE [Candidatus Saccharibacteria bacterium]|nr:nucleotide exchange factor GrpE [Candidatus Saccharibacteria bacterium]
MKKTPQKPVTQNDDELAAQVIAELTADVQRVQAEFINYKARVEVEKAMLSQYSKAQVIKDLLPVIDDLERALNHLPEDLTEHKWAQGVQKIHSRLQQQLEKLGITKIEALNQPFDPELHEAVQVEGDGDTQVVTEIIQNGYSLGGQVIRHAIVKVTNT